MLKDINLKPSDLMQKVYEFAKKPIGFFLISGPNGTGKSFIAEALYYTQTPFKLPQYDSDLAIFITQADLNEEWKQNSMESPVFLSSKYKNTKLLVLDDLGTRKPTDAFLDFLYLILDHRYKNRHNLGTIITTNRNAREFQEIFGDAILSRVGSGFKYRLEGNDRRVCNF